MKHAFFTGICSGIMVGIGGAIFLACAKDGLAYKYVGAILFSVALLTICMLGFYLYTGKVGLIGESCTLCKVKALGLGLIGNYIGAALTGVVVGFVSEPLHDYAVKICKAKLEMSYMPLKALVLGAFCGILMYVAVKIFAAKSSSLGILFCIPTFILAGFEHSIADIFYMSASFNFGGWAFLFLFMVVIGNSVGGVILPLLVRLANGWNQGKEKPATNTSDSATNENK